LSRDGVVKVLDMGLARFEHSLSEGEVIGTVSYMAPEQTVEMGRADARSDIYALGCTLYRLLTGDVPFHRETAEATMAAQREAPIPSLRKHRRDVAPALDAILQRMLAKRPTDRYQSMRELIADLKALSTEAGSAKQVPARAPGDDFKPDLLSSLLSLGPGAAGDLLDNPADQTWDPSAISRQRTASPSRTVANRSPAPASNPESHEVRPDSRRSFPWVWMGVVGGLVLIAALVAIRLATAPPQNEVIATSNPAEQSKKSEPTAQPEVKTPPPSGNPAKEANSEVGPESPAKTAAKIPDRPKPSDPDRAVAEWLSPYGADLYVALDDDGARSINVKKPADIPATPFTLRYIQLARMPRETERFAELRRLQKLAMFVADDIPVDDSFVLCLPQTEALESLSFRQTQISDAAVAHLTAFPNLNQLNLSKNPRITGDAYVKLAPLAKLKTVELDQDSLDDAAMAHLSRIPALQNLTLTSRKITGTGLKALAGVSNLLDLALHGTAITDDDFATIGRHTSLLGLHVTDCPCRNVTDEGLRHLAQAGTLYRLWVNDCSMVTDPGLEHLHRLTKLVELGVKGTKVTKPGIEAFKRAVPKCIVSAD
jgi:hypothetical protein